MCLKVEVCVVLEQQLANRDAAERNGDVDGSAARGVCDIDLRRVLGDDELGEVVVVGNDSLVQHAHAIFVLERQVRTLTERSKLLLCELANQMQLGAVMVKPLVESGCWICLFKGLLFNVC